MDSDRKRIAAMRTLEALGYTYRSSEWQLPAGPPLLLPAEDKDDATHGALLALMRRADALVGCTEGSDEEADLEAIADALGAYEAKQ